MSLDFVVAEHDVELLTPRVLPQPHRLRRRILPIVIEVDDESAPGMTPAREDGVVLAEVPGMLHERDWNP